MQFISFELFALFVIFAALVAMILAPLESLTWWAGWFGERDELARIDLHKSDDSQTYRLSGKRYVVYLTGISGFSERSFLPREEVFLDRLQSELDDIIVVDDIYPYSVTNTGLVDNRLLASFWRFTVRRKIAGSPIGFLINLRNILQIMVAADGRYGPIYAHGIAEVIIEGLRRHGYPVGSGIPITLIGYSGGGEMAISAVRPLTTTLKTDVTVISLGGVLSNDPNILDVSHLYHIYSQKDRVQLLGPLLFPGRWRIMYFSYWNQMRREGKISLIDMGPMGHNGPGGYLDAASYLPSGESYLDKTLTTIEDLIESDYPLGATVAQSDSV
jgi:hypothetical protein